MDETKKCNHETALKQLYSGAFVFTHISTPITKYVRGCRKCRKQIMDNYCSTCGSKITDKLEVAIGYDTTYFRLKRINNIVYMETKKSKNDLYGNRRKCNFSLDFFMKQPNWSWIWP